MIQIQNICQQLVLTPLIAAWPTLLWQMMTQVIQSLRQSAHQKGSDDGFVLADETPGTKGGIEVSAQLVHPQKVQHTASIVQLQVSLRFR